MIQKPYDIDLDKCTPLTRKVLVETLENAEKYRMEFITPEHLLFSITLQEEFKQFCDDFFIDLGKMRSELIPYIQDMDRVAEEEEYEFKRFR